MEKYSIPGLYYKYKSISDEEIRGYLKNIKLVKKEHKGTGTIFGYYELNEDSLNGILENTRGQSLTFDATATKSEPITNLVEYKTITFLIKSSSRFFLKPDIGEVFDQIHFRILTYDVDAICVNLDDYTLLEDTDGEHFLMTATLLINKEKLEEKECKKAIQNLYNL